MLPVTIYCYKINFIVTSKIRALEKPLIVMDQLWHLVIRCKKSSIFWVGGRTKAEARYTPADAIARAGHVGRGLTKGGGVLLVRTMAYYLVKESQGVTMMSILSWRRGQNG